ncbi:MAG: hypothetical protein GQ540_03240 [Lutibacter sp.]|uniref:hypothetical protein n=1 Tax=Lutibacter sp. TaxID=1925666 RepID=UPI0019FAD494|nr:hypothetical protein [Lutibacter sp.]NOR27526.1 hypothetical protein [Lutibacter sp.]
MKIKNLIDMEGGEVIDWLIENQDNYKLVEIGYFVEVIRIEDNMISKRFGPMSERKAEKVEDGIMINLNDDYVTRIINNKED